MDSRFLAAAPPQGLDLIRLDIGPIFFAAIRPHDKHTINSRVGAETEMDSDVTRAQVAPVGMRPAPQGVLPGAENGNLCADAEAVGALRIEPQFQPVRFSAGFVV